MPAPSTSGGAPLPADLHHLLRLVPQDASLAYDLYGLTEEEIAVVEGAA